MSFIWMIVLLVWSVIVGPWHLPLVAWLILLPCIFQDLCNDTIWKKLGL